MHIIIIYFTLKLVFKHYDCLKYLTTIHYLSLVMLHSPFSPPWHFPWDIAINVTFSLISVSWPCRLKPLLHVTTILCEIWLCKEKKKHKDQGLGKKSSILLSMRERERESMFSEMVSLPKYINRSGLVFCMHFQILVYTFLTKMYFNSH